MQVSNFGSDKNLSILHGQVFVMEITWDAGLSYVVYEQNISLKPH